MSVMRSRSESRGSVETIAAAHGKVAQLGNFDEMSTPDSPANFIARRIAEGSGGLSMISVSVTFKGDRSDVGRIIRQIAFAIEAQMKLLMTGPKTGRVYRRGSRTHQASAPGEAPAVDTGFLINSIQTTIKSDTEAEIIIPAEYAEALEFGTDRLEARPFVRPAIDSVIKDFERGGILAGLSN